MVGWKLSIAALLVGLSGLLGLNSAHSQAADPSVLTYHGHANRSGHYTVPMLNWERARGLRLDRNFTAWFSGHVYAQPLYWRRPGSDSGLLLVATESNDVYALDARTGREVWHRSLGKPVPRSALGCGNINPLGITGTPAIDPSSGIVYLDAAVADTTGPRHKLFALSIADGKRKPGWPVDVTEALKAKHETFVAADQNQRGALLISHGRLYVPFGGHYGDCGTYHGWVIGISLDDPKQVVSWRTRARGGGIWAPGGISSDGRALFVATGNTFGARTWSDGEAVIRLAPNLNRSEDQAEFFAPTDWKALDQRDADLGGTNPLPFDLAGTERPQHLLLALGKDRRAYLLDREHLGGLGGALSTETVATGAIRTAPATYPGDDGMMIAFQGEGANCPKAGDGGLTVLRIPASSAFSIKTAWCARLRGAGAPIVTTTDGHSNPIVWILGAEGDNRLHGFRGDNGEPLFESEPLTGLRHFQTLIATEDRLYVAADGTVYAFAF